MTEQSLDQTAIINEIETLLVYYSFEAKEDSYSTLINNWLTQYSPQWIRLAVLEALYLGRYKIASIEQILASWSRKGNYTLRFNHDFESLICRNIVKKITQKTTNQSPNKLKPVTSIPQFQPDLSTSDFFLKLKSVAQFSLDN
ncbi:MAG: hypothetical protein EA365_14920 [Gloeocapsa sp. DLM2.Bin57]|nr:MAG: hypothetical protein EA365_14920 [Gloeocapsa sp. DLM2.Bin57]